MQHTLLTKSKNLFINKKFRYFIIASVIIGLTALKLFTTNYSYGTVNHGEIIPIHNRLEDSTYLVNDDYVNRQMEYNVRSNFAYLMYGTRQATFETVEYHTIYLGYYILLVLASFTGIFMITKSFSKSLLIRLSTTILFATTVSITVGGVSLIGGHLLPGTFAATALVWAIYTQFNKKQILMFILVAIAIYSHILIGLLGGIAICGTFFILNIRKSPKTTLIQSGIFALAVLPMILPQLMSSGSSFGGDSEQIGFIIGFFRNPHHYIPSTWPLRPLFTLAVVETIAIIATIKFQKDKYVRNSVIIIFLLTGFMYLGGYILTEVKPITPAIKLQLFRINTITDLLSRVILISYSLTLLAYLIQKLPKISNQAKYALTIVAIIIISLIGISNRSMEINRELNYTQKQPSKSQVAAFEWISSNTPEQAVFIIPVDINDFRLQTNRAMVVNFKQFVFKDEQVIDWYNRISDHCGFEAPQCTGWECTSYCKTKYQGYNDEQFNILTDKYSADYILTSDDHKLGFELVYRDANYSIYKVN